MKKVILISLVIVVLAACSTVMITGRKQFNIVSDSEILSESSVAYSDFIKTAPISKNAKNTAMVKQVGAKIAAAVETYMRDNGMSASLKNYSWEYNLVQSDEANAFCMPGGKIVVYEGILPATQDETGLAVVIGHEVAHAIAKHSNERMSQQVAIQLAGAGADILLSQKSAATRNAIGTLYGIGTQVGVLLPYSRTHELEADRLGLIFMAMAGYDPNQAVNFWQRMSAGGSGAPLEILSTHPSDNTRIAKIREALPEALKYYKK